MSSREHDFDLDLDLNSVGPCNSTYFTSTKDSSTSPLMDSMGEDVPEATNSENNEHREQREEVNSFQNKKRKKPLKISEEFEDLDRSYGKMAEYQSNSYSADEKTRVSLLNTSGRGSINNIQNSKYDHAKVREAAAHMVLIHEYPFNHMEHEMFNTFMRTVTPHWEEISSTTLQNDCVATYEFEKKKLMTLLKCVDKISISIDLWKSGQDVEYMVVTGHFTYDWNIHKRVLNFVHVPSPPTGIGLTNALYKCLVDWGIEDKVTTFTVDNALYNDSTLKFLRDIFSFKNKLPLEGKIFHTRCTAHILNLMAQDGLQEIHQILENVRSSVKYLSHFEARLVKFSEIREQLQLPSRLLLLDCPPCWNSTYLMLTAALEFKEVFARYQDRDPVYKYLLKSEDWEKVETVCQFLEVFNEVTKIITENEYPTSNLFLVEVWRVKEILNINSVDNRPYIQAMALRMKEKFDKYWSESNLLMAIAAILDPRYKMILVEYCYSEIYEEQEASRNITVVRDALFELYNEYVTSDTSRIVALSELGKGASSKDTNTGSLGKSVVSGKSMFESYVRKVDSIQVVKSELNVYLKENVYICDDVVDASFDALEWWKVNNLKFPTLSKMACDILSIPLCTVASEFTSSAGDRVIDSYYASLSTEIAQVLMCGGDWVRNLRGIKKSPKNGLDGIKEIFLP